MRKATSGRGGLTPVATRCPDSKSFLTDVPLYSEYRLSGDDATPLSHLEFFEDSLDAFCLECGQPSVFHNVAPPRAPVTEHGPNPGRASYRLESINHQGRVVSVELKCARNQAHRIYFFFRVKDGTITKIGQYPSFRDFNTYELKKYRSILGDMKYGELNCAVGLYSHNVGIGGFVYLRRILEGLIEEAHAEAAKKDGWDEKLYLTSRVRERIGLVKDGLPEFLIKNASIYAILSKGIHELSEDECLKHFDAMIVGIELILDDKIAKRERENKVEQAQKAIARAMEDVSSSSAGDVT